MPHLATTYAAVNTLITLGGEKSLASINRWSVYALQSKVLAVIFLLFCLVELCSRASGIDLHFENIIFRDKLYGFMRRMKQPNGGFRSVIVFIYMHSINNKKLH